MYKKFKPVIRNDESRMVEVEIYGKRMVLCVKCYNKRAKNIKINLSVYQADHWHKPLDPCHMLFQVASWEKIKCIDCGRKNSNTNMTQRELYYDGSLKPRQRTK